jgi:hypothetical protein
MKSDFWREAIVAGVLVAGLTSAALADPWRQGEPGGLAAPRQMPTLPVRERLEPGTAFGSPGGSFRPGVAESTLPRSAGAPRSPGVTRAVEARGEPIVLRLGFQRMVQVQFGAEIQQVITVFTKQQVSMETVGPRLFLSALEPDLSGELFVTLAGGTTLTLIVVPAIGMERDLVVRVISPAAEPAARATETAGLTPLRLLRAMIRNTPLPGVSPTPGGGHVVYEDGALRLTRLATWTSPALEGVILGVENLRPLWVTVPLDRLAFPGLLAVHAESESLAPPPATPEQALAARHRTRLYLVRTAGDR